jgi:hypothetical protein
MHTPLPSSRLAWYALGRFWPTGPKGEQVFDAGYFAHLDLQGAETVVPNQPLGPGSAYFTFSSEPLTVTPLQSGPLTVSRDTVGSFWVFYQRAPRGDFAKPGSFAQGLRIARFRRPFMVVGAKLGELSLSTFSAELVESTPFEHDGRTYDLGALLPNGITQWSVATGSTSETEATFLGSAVAIGASPSSPR